MTHSDKPVIFTMPVNIRTLSKKGSHLGFEASVEVCDAIAKTYDLLAVEKFDANATVTPWKKQGVKIVGQVSADVIQPCALTMEPLSVGVDEEFDVLMVPSGSKLALPKIDGEGEMVVDPEAPDLPDTFKGDIIDLADIWLEFFVLGLDPFAQKPGAALPDSAFGEAEDDARQSPFAALAALKKH